MLPKYSYCPKCKGELINKKDHYKCKKCGYQLFLHSAPTTSVFIIKDDCVLLAKRKYDPKKGTLDSIGGFIQYGEHPINAGFREVKEETGLEIDIVQMLPINMDEYEYQSEKIPTLNFTYIAKIKEGQPKPSDDVEELIWVPIFEIPFEKIGFDSVKSALIDLERWYKEHY